MGPFPRFLALLTVITAVNSFAVFSQCTVHPNGKTALRFSNESRYELTFFVDDEQVGITVSPRQVTSEREILPGEHILKARAVLERQELWVWSWNEVPAGYLCVWTVEDPKTGRSKWAKPIRRVGAEQPRNTL